MKFSAQCPHCQARLDVESRLSGESVSCPGCGERFTCPEPRAPDMAVASKPPVPPLPASKVTAKEASWPSILAVVLLGILVLLSIRGWVADSSQSEVDDELLVKFERLSAEHDKLEAKVDTSRETVSQLTKATAQNAAAIRGNTAINTRLIASGRGNAEAIKRLVASVRDIVDLIKPQPSKSSPPPRPIFTESEKAAIANIKAAMADGSFTATNEQLKVIRGFGNRHLIDGYISYRERKGGRNPETVEYLGLDANEKRGFYSQQAIDITEAIVFVSSCKREGKALRDREIRRGRSNVYTRKKLREILGDR